MSNAQRQARWRERRDSELERLRAENASLRKEIAELRAGASPSVPQPQQRPLNVGDTLYTAGVYRIQQATISRITVASVVLRYDGDRREARVALDELLAAGAAGPASASDGRIWMRDARDDLAAAGLRVKAFRRTKVVRKLQNRVAAIASARKEVQRTHPDKGGDAADFRKAKAKLDRLMAHKRK